MLTIEPSEWLSNNISSVVEFKRWWVLKSKIFGLESRFKEIPPMNDGSSKSAKIVLSKSIFDVKNQQFFFSFKNTNLGDYFLVATITLFSSFNF